MPPNTKGPRTACNSGEAPIKVVSTNQPTQSPSKRKPGNFWFEDGGRYLFSSGANGTTVFDVWKLIGEPLPKRGRA